MYYKIIHDNDNICECSRHLKETKNDMIRKSPGRLFHHFRAATVKASPYIRYR